MGAPVSSTVLINRKTLPEDRRSGSDAYSARPFIWARWHDELSRENCESDEDDFEFFAEFVQKAGVDVQGRKYFTVDNYTYWTTRGLRQTLTIRRAEVLTRR